MRLLLNAIDNEVTWNKKQYLLQAGERLNLDVAPFKRMADDMDYVLNIEPFDFVKGKKWTGIWEIDLLCDRGETGVYWHAADHVFTAISTIPSRLNGWKWKAQTLFQACDPELDKPMPKVLKEYDMVFANSYGPIYGERQRIQELLEKKYHTFYFGVGVRLPEYIHRLNQGKIQFIRSANTGIGDGELAQRFFECLAIGPVITNWVDDLHYTGLIEGTDYFAYYNDEDMFNKIDKLLADQAFASKMAENGRKKALMYHTYDHRLISIINNINEYEKSK